MQWGPLSLLLSASLTLGVVKATGAPVDFEVVEAKESVIAAELTERFALLCDLRSHTSAFLAPRLY